MEYDTVSDGAVGLRSAKEFTGLGKTYLYALIRSGEIQTVKVGGRSMFP
jgi:hypothetical protein